MTERESNHSSWWNTLPGLITAIAALITAVGGFYLIINKGDKGDTSKKEIVDSSSAGKKGKGIIYKPLSPSSLPPGITDAGFPEYPRFYAM